MSQWKDLQKFAPFIQENWEKAGYDQPTAVQEETISTILEGKDLIVESPTGTGKTLAYLLPIIQKLDETIQNVQAVILVPSRELSMQILEEIRKFTKGTTIKGASFIGGANIKKQVEKLKDRPQIVVGTPGRVLELIQAKKLKMHEVKTIVIDEADQLIANEHIQIIKNIIKATLKERQLLFFSATITKEAQQIASELGKSPQFIRIQQKNQGKHIAHLYIKSEQREKIDVLRKIMHTNPGRTIAFLKNTNKVEEAAIKLQYHGINLAVLAGEGKKKERKEAIVQFRSGKVPLLLTTDVAARGLDIQDVQTVIHFDFPSTTEQYLHRSGRTGRMGKEGTVISIVNAIEEGFLQKMGKELQVDMIEKQLRGGKLVHVKR